MCSVTDRLYVVCQGDCVSSVCMRECVYVFMYSCSIVLCVTYACMGIVSFYVCVVCECV